MKLDRGLSIAMSRMKSGETLTKFIGIDHGALVNKTIELHGFRIPSGELFITDEVIKMNDADEDRLSTPKEEPKKKISYAQCPCDGFDYCDECE